MKSTNFVEALTTDIESKVAPSTGPVFTEAPSAKGADTRPSGNDDSFGTDDEEKGDEEKGKEGEEKPKAAPPVPATTGASAYDEM